MQFIINESEGVVVALNKSVHNQLHKAVLKACPFLLMRASGMTKFIKRFPDTYRGVARCSPEDEWDEDTGRQKAEARAMLNYRIAEGKTLEYLREVLAAAAYSAGRAAYHAEDCAEDAFNDAYPN